MAGMAYRGTTEGEAVPCLEGNADETGSQGAQEDARGTAVDRASVDGGDEALEFGLAPGPVRAPLLFPVGQK